MDPSFEHWLNNHGVKAHGIAVGNFEGVRGVKATEAIPKGAMLLQVPERVLMSTASAARDPAFAAALQRLPEASLTPEERLTCHLLHEVSKQEASLWLPYLRQLPQSYNLLMTWSEEAVQALQAPHAVQCAQAAIQAAHSSWQGARQLMHRLGLSSKYCSWKAWLWAASTICSRTMHVPFCPAGVLTPYGDLHNYSPPEPPAFPNIGAFHVRRQHPSQTSSSTHESGDGGFHDTFQEYCLYARRSYAPGEQIMLCYGEYTNLELLEHYGFMLPDNPHDSVSLPLGLFSQAFRAYARQQPSPTSQRPFLHANGIPCWTLLHDVRMFCASPLERGQWAHLAAACEPMTPACERRALTLLLNACYQAATLLPAPSHADGELSPELHAPQQENVQLALRWRVSQMRIIECAINGLSSAIAAIEN